MLDQLLRTASMEVSAREREAAVLCRDLLAPGTRVYINFAPGDTHHGMVAAAARLAQAGFRPVPHVAVRHLASFTQLRDYLGRAVGEAGVEQVLLIGGDIAQPVGPFGSSLQALATGVFEQSGLRRIGLAGYPEGHPKIDARALDDALLAKLALARRAGLAPYVVSQFCLGRHRSSTGSAACAPRASMRRCMSAWPGRPASRRWRAMPCAAASAIRSAPWSAARPRSPGC